MSLLAKIRSLTSHSVFFVVKLLYGYLTFLVNRKAWVLLLVSILSVISIISNLRLSKLVLILALVLLPICLYYVILRLLSPSLSSFQQWRQSHPEIRLEQFYAYFSLAFISITISVLRDYLSALCKIDELEFELSKLQGQLAVIKPATHRALESLELGELQDVLNWLSGIELIISSCVTCGSSFNWCSLWDDLSKTLPIFRFFSEVHASGSVENPSASTTSSSGSSSVKPRVIPNAACDKIMDMMQQCAQNGNCDSTKFKMIVDATIKICETKERGPWIQGPLWTNQSK